MNKKTCMHVPTCTFPSLLIKYMASSCRENHLQPIPNYTILSKKVQHIPYSINPLSTRNLSGYFFKNNDGNLIL